MHIHLIVMKKLLFLKSYFVGDLEFGVLPGGVEKSGM